MQHHGANGGDRGDEGKPSNHGCDDIDGMTDQEQVERTDRAWAGPGRDRVCDENLEQHGD